MMSRRLLRPVLFSVVVFVSPTGPARTQDSATVLETSIEHAIDDFVATRMEADRIPGVMVALVGNGRLVHLQGYGFADLEARTPVDARNTVFRVGSVSKTLTATAVIDRVDRGALDLDTDIRSYLRDRTIPDSEYRPITLFHLLTQTAGFDEVLFGQHAATPEDWEPLGDYLGSHLPPRFIQPGQIITYNDHHTSLAGLVLERVAGVGFARLFEESLFRPLGMRHTTFEQVALPALVEENLGRSYRSVDNRHVPYSRDYIKTTPAAGAMTAASDMARFMLELLVEDDFPDRFLSASAIDTQLAVQFTNRAPLPGRAFGFAESEHSARQVLFKDGQATGFSARLLLVPEERIGLFSAHNLSIFGTMGRTNRANRFHRELGELVLDHFLTEERPDQPRQKPELPTGFTERAGRFVGTYRNTVASRHTLEKVVVMMDDITVYDPGDGSLQIGSNRYMEIGPTLFQWEGGGPN